jgi:hypothetical protein
MKMLTGIISGTLLIAVLISFNSCSWMQRGPNGGTLVSLKNSNAKAEILADAGNGTVLIYTWEHALKKKRPISYKPLMIGSGNETVDLQPYPTVEDSAGYCSRFFGKADWLRGGHIRHGWLGGGMEQIRHGFNWKNCWRAGETLGSLFDKMDKNPGGMTGDGTGGMMKNDSGTVADNAGAAMMEHK